MSSTLSKEGILHVQRTCSCCGIYEGPLDGKWSKAVDDAEAAYAGRCAELSAELGSFDPRSERAIATLMVPAQAVARRFMRIAGEFEHTVRIISGSRSYAEQDALYAIGRTTQMNRSPVTNARSRGQRLTNV